MPSSSDGTSCVSKTSPVSSWERADAAKRRPLSDQLMSPRAIGQSAGISKATGEWTGYCAHRRCSVAGRPDPAFAIEGRRWSPFDGKPDLSRPRRQRAGEALGDLSAHHGNEHGGAPLLHRAEVAVRRTELEDEPLGGSIVAHGREVRLRRPTKLGLPPRRHEPLRLAQKACIEALERARHRAGRIVRTSSLRRRSVDRAAMQAEAIFHLLPVDDLGLREGGVDAATQRVKAFGKAAHRSPVVHAVIEWPGVDDGHVAGDEERRDILRDANVRRAARITPQASRSLFGT